MRKCDTVKNIHEVINDPYRRRYHKESTVSISDHYRKQ